MTTYYMNEQIEALPPYLRQVAVTLRKISGSEDPNTKRFDQAAEVIEQLQQDCVNYRKALREYGAIIDACKGKLASAEERIAKLESVNMNFACADHPIFCRCAYFIERRHYEKLLKLDAPEEVG